MTRGSPPDAVVVGSGPNGLAAGIVLAQAGLAVEVLEGAETIGGGMRTAELTLPGFRHDVCSAVHPLALSSPLFRALDLEAHGLQWVQPDLALAHPFDDGSAAVLSRSLEETAAWLGGDGPAYLRLLAPLVRAWPALAEDVLAPLRLPRRPTGMARFGWHAVRPAASLAREWFRGPRAQALFAGLAAHAMVPLHRPPSAAYGLVLAMAAHSVGFPVARGGSQSLAEALALELRSLGGRIEAGRPVRSLGELGTAQLVLLDVTPRQLLQMDDGTLAADYRRRLERFRYGPGVFKMDWALSEPVPWRAEACRRAVSLHLGGSLEEIARSVEAVNRGEHPERPYVIVCQQSLCDPGRAPEGKHTLWAYCHVPNASEMDVTERIESQIERFAPGFRDCVLARHVLPPKALEEHNPNYVGGDINGGIQDLRQLFFRPVVAAVPYATSAPWLYLCSSSTPPGGGVHGMCGYHAARAALRRGLGRR
ncbi:MAG: NAD(P)/FAD-dependent oxidoreductase [Anaerolineae bacterium]|nr:NAD(P)/FAD-dependent oxidoreductase [Anaerolineae bacterium]